MCPGVQSHHEAERPEMQRAERMWFVLAPEGTRRAVEHWKPGFWRIARRAGVGGRLASDMLAEGAAQLTDTQPSTPHEQPVTDC